MKNSKFSLLCIALLAGFALVPAANATDPLSAEAQGSLKASHQTTEGFEPGQHPDFAHFPAKRRAKARRIQSMTPEQGQATRQERGAARQEIRDQGQERTEEQTL